MLLKKCQFSKNNKEHSIEILTLQVPQKRGLKIKKGLKHKF